MPCISTRSHGLCPPAPDNGHLDQRWREGLGLKPIYLIGGQLCPQAYDDDQPGTNNSRLLFSLLPGSYSQNFSIDPDTGLLRNLGPLDREAIDPALEGRIVLTVHVADCGEPSLSTDVNVTITVEVSRVLSQSLAPWFWHKLYFLPQYSMVDKRLGTGLQSLWPSLSLSQEDWVRNQPV